MRVVDNSPFTALTTDIKGEFTFKDVPEGKYYIKIDFMGYQSKRVDCIVTDSSVKFEKPITLTVNNFILSAVHLQLLCSIAPV